MGYIDTIKIFFPSAERQTLRKRDFPENSNPYLSYDTEGPGYKLEIDFYNFDKSPDYMNVDYRISIRGSVEKVITSTAEELTKDLAYIKGLALGLVMNTSDRIVLEE